MRKLLVVLILAATIAGTALRAEVTRYVGADGQPREISHDASLDEYRAALRDLQRIVDDQVGMGKPRASEIETKIIDNYFGNRLKGIELGQRGGVRPVIGHESVEYAGLFGTSPKQEDLWYLEKQLRLAEHRKESTAGRTAVAYQDEVISKLKEEIHDAEAQLKTSRQYSVYPPELLDGSLRLSAVTEELKHLDEEIDAAERRKKAAAGKSSDNYEQALAEESKLVDRRWVLYDLRQRLKELPGALAAAHAETGKKLQEFRHVPKPTEPFGASPTICAIAEGHLGQN